MRSRALPSGPWPLQPPIAPQKACARFLRALHARVAIDCSHGDGRTSATVGHLAGRTPNAKLKRLGGGLYSIDSIHTIPDVPSDRHSSLEFVGARHPGPSDSSFDILRFQTRAAELKSADFFEFKQS
jgi:hypothetical protein